MGQHDEIGRHKFVSYSRNIVVKLGEFRERLTGHADANPEPSYEYIHRRCRDYRRDAVLLITGKSAQRPTYSLKENKGRRYSPDREQQVINYSKMSSRW